MKVKTYFYITFLIIFIAYLFSADYIFNIGLKVNDESPYVRLDLPDKSANAKMYIENTEERQIGWKNMILIEGWAFEKFQKSQDTDVYVVLKSGDNEYVYKIGKFSRQRSDVAEAFDLDDDMTGFAALIAREIISNGNYRLGLVFSDGKEKRMYLSDQYISIDVKGVSIN